MRGRYFTAYNSSIADNGRYVCNIAYKVEISEYNLYEDKRYLSRHPIDEL